MGMFGYVGKRLLNNAGKNLLGVDFMGEAEKRQQQEAIQRAQLQAAGLLRPQPGAMRQAPVANADGEDITSGFGPQMEQGPSRQRAPQEIAAELADITSRTQGFNPKPYLDMAQYAKPDVRFDRGFGYEGATGAPMGGYHPDLGQGVRPTADGGAQAIGGYADAVAGIEGAKTGAQEQQKAAYDLVDVPSPTGGTIKMPRLMAGQILGRQAASGGLPGGLGRSQTPAEAIRANGAATNDVERQGAAQSRAASAGRQLSALDNMERLLPDVISGFGAGPKLQAARAMAAMGNPEATKKVKATEVFLNQGRVLVADMIKSFGANPTEGERKYAERMSGADADLNAETLKEGIALQRQRIARDLRDAGQREPSSGRQAPPPRTAIEAELRRRGLLR